MGGGVQTADDDVAAAPDTEELVRTACRRRPTECFAPKAAMISEIKQSFCLKVKEQIQVWIEPFQTCYFCVFDNSSWQGFKEMVTDTEVTANPANESRF